MNHHGSLEIKSIRLLFLIQYLKFYKNKSIIDIFTIYLKILHAQTETMLIKTKCVVLNIALIICFHWACFYCVTSESAPLQAISETITLT